MPVHHHVDAVTYSIIDGIYIHIHQVVCYVGMCTHVWLFALELCLALAEAVDYAMAASPTHVRAGLLLACCLWLHAIGIVARFDKAISLHVDRAMPSCVVQQSIVKYRGLTGRRAITARMYCPAMYDR